MDGIVWIHQERLRLDAEGKTLEEIGREWRDAMLAAAEGRVVDYPDWMAESVDSGRAPE